MNTQNTQAKIKTLNVIADTFTAGEWMTPAAKAYFAKKAAAAAAAR